MKMAEDRFARVSSDPRFKKIPRKQRKVKIDARFQRMFTDKSFTTQYFVDKRGAIVGKTSKEDLHKFYELSDEEEENEVDQKTTQDLPIKQQSSDILKTTESRKAKKNRKNTKTRKKTTSVELKSIKESKQRTLDSDSDNEDNENDLTVNEIGDTKRKNTKHITGNLEESGGSDSESGSVGIDYARGEGNAESSSDDKSDGGDEYLLNKIDYDDDDDTEDDEESFEDKDAVEHQWGELDRNTKTTSEVTRRLAVCNLDWDRVTAQDLFVLFSSLGSRGVIQSVKIYPSEFGLQRMENEEHYGPEELREQENEDDDDGSNQEGSKFSREKLRQYQLNKLKYYYAVIECDSTETGNYLYEECDGVEFELTGNLLDLRFIPDNVEFEHEPLSAAMEMPDLATYKPPEYETTALHQSNVKLTWDETDTSRVKMTQRKFSKDDLQDMDFEAYLASSSGEEGEEESGPSEGENSENEEEKIAKYKKLLQDIDSKEHEDDNDKEMEITWEPGLKESAEDLVMKKRAEREEKGLTPWEKYLKKKKEKKKERRAKDNEKRNQSRHEEDDEDSDDVPVDMSNPFFSQDFGPDFPPNKHDSKPQLMAKKKKGKGRRDEPETEEEKKSKEELELLVMDDDDERQHFSLKGILESEKKTKRKNRRKAKMKEGDKTTSDAFEVDVNDPRFTAMYTSHHYALDPSHSQFKKTKAMEAILSEKHRRRDHHKETSKSSGLKRTSDTTEESKQTKDPSLSLLVKSIKSKTEEFQDRKKKRRTAHL